MASNINKFINDNKDNFKIGFLLELNFRQTDINSKLLEFKSFLCDNEEFFNNINIDCFCSSIDSIINLFSNISVFLATNVDSIENYCNYHKKFT